MAKIQNIMTPEEFEKKLHAKSQQIKEYSLNRFPTKAGNITLRFVNGNFRAQGFQGTTFKKWKKNKRNGTTLVKTGKLRAANFFTTQAGQSTLKNTMPYAKANNDGFKGVVSIKSHTRNKYATTKIGTGKFTKTGKERTKSVTHKSGESEVKGHTRKINIPQRQFIPTLENPSPVLNKAILREVERDLKNIIE